MKGRWLVVTCALLLAIPVGAAAATYPRHEVWHGLGGASSPEKDILNVPSDLESSPDLVICFGYTRNLDAHKAVSFHLYGGSETTPTVTLAGPSGTVDTEFDLFTYNLGVRYRHTFMRGGIMPYAFVGASGAFGSIESSPTGKFTYKGLSAVVGPGAAVQLGKYFQLAGELFGSFGVATWEQQPFNNSSGDEFDPGLLGGTINLAFTWGWQ